MKYLSLLPLITLYVWLSVASIPHFFRGDYYDFPHTGIWVALTFCGAIALPVLIFN